MSRYVIQFYKEGNMRYISHLDLLRLFKRTFKRTGIKLIYSQGFNPHPKMSFVQPLSLGYSSQREYLDFETIEQLPLETIVARLNGAMPNGVGITAGRQLPSSKRTLAAVVEYASYDVAMKLHTPCEWRKKLSQFLTQNEILVEKKQKKSGKMIQQDIRPMILEAAATEGKSTVHTDITDDNYIALTLLICAGSNRNLNPEVLLSSFCRYCGIPYDAQEVSVCRKELYYGHEPDDKLISIFEYQLKE